MISVAIAVSNTVDVYVYDPLSLPYVEVYRKVYDEAYRWNEEATYELIIFKVDKAELQEKNINIYDWIKGELIPQLEEKFPENRKLMGVIVSLAETKDIYLVKLEGVHHGSPAIAAIIAVLAIILAIFVTVVILIHMVKDMPPEDWQKLLGIITGPFVAPAIGVAVLLLLLAMLARRPEKRERKR